MCLSVPWLICTSQQWIRKQILKYERKSVRHLQCWIGRLLQCQFRNSASSDFMHHQRRWLRWFRLWSMAGSAWHWVQTNSSDSTPSWSQPILAKQLWDRSNKSLDQTDYHDSRWRRDARWPSLSKVTATPRTLSTRMDQKRWRKSVGNEKTSVIQPGDTQCDHTFGQTVAKPNAVCPHLRKKESRPEFLKIILETPRTTRRWNSAHSTERPGVRWHQHWNFEEIHRWIWNIQSWRYRHEGSHIGTCAQSGRKLLTSWIFFVNEAIWSMFMNDCMWAVFYVRDEGEKSREFWWITKFTKYRRSLKLRKPDFKTSQTLPQNSLNFHCCKTGKHNPGIKYIHWNLIENRRTCISQTLSCVWE